MRTSPLIKQSLLLIGLSLSAMLVQAKRSFHHHAGTKFVAPRTARAITAEAASAELKMVVLEADNLYDRMGLEEKGLSEEAFEYAWRGYHNLLKKGLIKKKSVLSICDFSQSSCSKRMYVIDVRRRKLLYRTYVAHGRNSGDEYASSFSN
ncbi:MAG TPA: murein L,D-transpeptidase catalytic domain family protein, partial [Puia sp.]|nr:murein L,D-transpeptidase catalytic domain family protein [Puia sp.]